VTREDWQKMILDQGKEIEAVKLRLNLIQKHVDLLEKRHERRQANTQAKQEQREGTAVHVEKQIADVWQSAYGKGLAPAFLFNRQGPLRKLINAYGWEDIAPVLSDYFRRTAVDLVSLGKFAGAYEARRERLRGNGQPPVGPYVPPPEWIKAQAWVAAHDGPAKAAQKIKDYAKTHGLTWAQAFGPMGVGGTISIQVGMILRTAGEGP
jgi:hypothetical protein